MADEEPKKPPTYAELVEQNEKLLAANVALKTKLTRSESVARARQIDLDAQKRKRPKRILDPKAASPYDRPWDGR